MDVALLTMDDNSPQPTSSTTSSTVRPHSTSPMLPDSNEILRMLTDPTSQIFAGIENSPKTQLERLLGGVGFDDSTTTSNTSSSFPFDPAALGGFADLAATFSSTLRNSSKTLKCPKCNWHYKYQETLEIHMKEKHSDADVKCVYCADNRPHPKLARGETYSCGYKPYRCDLCRYSTTTKGNLSIHMQSDKHLHAVQELPANIANFACGAPMSRASPIDEQLDAAPLICLICGVFATESLADMVEHVEKDRSRPTQGDVSIVNGCFRCHLCPYNTTLKANFQLHTRTDKHLQKVQTANHLREGARPHTAIYRLSNTKTSVQVLCRQCQEIISSTDLLREHCHSSNQQQQQQHPKNKIFSKIWKCKICCVELDSELLASGHMTCHEPSTWPDNIDFKMVEDAAYGCATGCGFTTKNIADLEDHAKSHEEGESSTCSVEKKTCPLCIELTDDLEKHLVDEHRIAESAIEKLLLVDQNVKQSTSEFSHQCTKCNMAFRTEAQLKAHTIQHVFSSYHKCPTCNDSFEDHNLLLTHMIEHNKEECEMCSESFASKEQFIAHLNSTKHLQQAKKHLENSLVDLSSQIGNDDEKSRCFRCNVCNQSYPQSNNLEIHMRTISHQTRMSRLSDLISTGEIDGDKPIVEQPGMPSPTIAQYIEQTTKQLAVNDVMSLLMKSETDENHHQDDPVSGIHVLTQIKVYGESKITQLVAGLDDKIDAIATFGEQKAADVSLIDCSTCGQQISGILALNLHYEEAHSSSIPSDVLKRFGEKLLAAIEEEDLDDKQGSPQSIESNDDDAPPEKRTKLDAAANNMSAASQFAMFSQMMNYLPFMQPGIPPEMLSQLMNPNASAAAAAAAAANNSNMNNSPAKRARTRITDEQLKVLRQYFNINNSPTESQIKEMSMKASLPEKVIKHWFRNTLFKERQRDKDSPYNFNIPPQMGIDLDTYEKTGEAKVVSLSSGEKSEINSARATPTIITTPSTSTAMTPDDNNKPAALDPTKINIHTMLSQLQQSNTFPFLDASFMAAAAAAGGPMAQIAQQQQQQQPCNTSSSGRRANRTRFTDFQLRTLQQFFDKQAYPKDDDLEALSKKLQLSPRVIVVWFQNARQKARKIFENQPNHDNSDRFVRTPGSNFQCKRCNQVFQRYYELIQHQQKRCYKDDGAALMNDNKSVEESLSDEEKAQLIAQQQQGAGFDIQKMAPNDLLKLLGGNPKSSNDVLLKMCETMSSGEASTSFHKMCPMCAQTFREKSSIIEHLQQKHSLIAPIDVELLPDADAINDSMVLDLSGSSVDLRESISASPTRSDDDIVTEQLDDSQFATFGIQIQNSSGCRSPANNKRYRTHLTPLQVQLMKNVFGDYKTPSMAECEMLGKEIGLHKRVVQVWFQNARAKERKTKGGHVDEELKSSMETKCEACDKQFATRLSLQDHLFSSEHISLLRNNLKREGVSDVATDNGQPMEKKAKSMMDMSTFPFNLMIGAAGFPMVDVNLFGTPISMLQIPDDVKSQIVTDIGDGKPTTLFSQDGQTIETLTALLPDDEKPNVEAIPKDVGWACAQCSNVFQEEKKLKEHQKTMCSCEKMLTLTQIHYSCKLCSSMFCLQNDYIMHLHSLPHIQFKP